MLVRQTWGSNYIDFLYDESGLPYSFVYGTVTNGTVFSQQYYYVKNLQGDVIAITDASCAIVVEYNYDAWGNILNIIDTSNNSIGTINPIRYRSYYYDTDTGFYYLQSRYYDPAVRRFINADGAISGFGGDILGYNQYAYCINNPVNMSDNEGNWPRWITKAVAILSLAASSFAFAILALQTIHYDVREALNSPVPENRKQADSQKQKWISSEDGGPSAACHQFSSEDGKNIKYVHKDGYREVMYDNRGEKITDPRDVGTFNFSPSGTPLGDVGHFAFDIVP